jgi:transcriptional regulator with XRE-family HTH domain
MPLSALTGTRLRERRLVAGLRQADVAAAAGISASYLNLIEHNRRRVGGALLERLGEALGLQPSAFTEGREAALLDDLRAAAAAAEGAGAEVERLEEFVGRYPGWAALVAGQHGRVMGLERALEALNDRVTHDPHLSHALHEVLSSLSSVRSTAAILAETDDLEPEWRARFHRNLHQDSERMAVGAEALVAYLDTRSGADADEGFAAPQEEMESWLRARDWQFSDEELQRGVEGEVASLASSAARALALDHLARAERDARDMPRDAFVATMQAVGPDPVALAERIGSDVPAVMRRMAALPEVQAGLVVCDASGTLVFRKPSPGFALPRFGAACALWPLYAALGRPMQPVEAVVEMSGQTGARHRVIAFCQTRHPAGLRGPELREASMLILPQPGREGEALRIGSTCRICPRAGCPARREPSIVTETG